MDILEIIATDHPNSIVLDGLDDAIIGITTDENIAYSKDKIIDIFIKRDNMSYEEAIEYY